MFVLHAHANKLKAILSLVSVDMPEVVRSDRGSSKLDARLPFTFSDALSNFRLYPLNSSAFIRVHTGAWLCPPFEKVHSMRGTVVYINN